MISRRMYQVSHQAIITFSALGFFINRRFHDDDELKETDDTWFRSQEATFYDEGT